MVKVLLHNVLNNHAYIILLIHTISECTCCSQLVQCLVIYHQYTYIKYTRLIVNLICTIYTHYIPLNITCDKLPLDRLQKSSLLIGYWHGAPPLWFHYHIHLVTQTYPDHGRGETTRFPIYLHWDGFSCSKSYLSTLY